MQSLQLSTALYSSATMTSTVEFTTFHFDAIRTSIHMADMHNLYQFYFRNVDSNKYGLYQSPNILERKFRLHAEVEDEVVDKDNLVVTQYYITDYAAHALSDALHKV